MDIAGASHKPGRVDFEGLVTFIVVVFFVFTFVTTFALPEVKPVLLEMMLGVMLLAILIVGYRAWRQHCESKNDGDS
jgi:hypothetical protein